MADLESDLARAQAWWAQLRGGMPATVAGLWFGLFDAAEQGQSVRTLYVAGTPSFDADDETGEWATEYVWESDERYIVLPGLAALPDQPYEVPLRYAVELVHRIDSWDSRGIGVAVGYDDGDFEVIHDAR